MSRFNEKVYLPPSTHFNKRVYRNLVTQLYHGTIVEEMEVEAYHKRSISGWTLHRKNGERILVVTKPTSANPYGQVLFVPDAIHPPCSRDDLVTSSRWLAPKIGRVGNEMDLAQIASSARLSWKDSISFIREERCGDDVIRPGLRPPQLGALFASLAHWTVTEEIGNVVMPTGTGKTETMGALLAHEQPEHLLVVVPTSALRDQIAEKFLSFGVLQQFGVIGKQVTLPLVGKIEHQLSTPQDASLFMQSCNVVIATMAVLGGCSDAVQIAIAKECSHVFIDEAHHVAARTWNGFREIICELNKPILQFTATPFRGDGKHIGGQTIFAYPLRKAQEEGYFTPIKFISLWEYNRDIADQKIAGRAIQALKDDLKAGHDHILMARTDTIARARQVFEIYAAVAKEYNPLIVHSDQPDSERMEAIEAIRARRCKVIVCVDMLGEGFDLPQLKIAALHDIHKSLAVTIQFIGRFTRSAIDIGEATIIANAGDAEVEEAIEDLYIKDSDWNVVLRRLSEGETSRHRQRTNFIDGFEYPPQAVPLQNIHPKMSTVTYQTACRDWNPNAVWDLLKGVNLLVEPTINPTEHVMLFVTREKAPVVWGETKTVNDVVHHLYLFYWDEQQKLLFINSTNNKSLHSALAKKIGGENVVLLDGEHTYRALDGVNRLILTNLGLLHLLNRASQFTMHVGSDIKAGLSQASIQNRRKSNLFGRGYENGERMTIGISYKGRVWSHWIAEDISAWVNWCKNIGRKLLDETISTDKILEQAIIPEEIHQRPPLVPLTIDWPSFFYERSDEAISVELGGQRAPFYDVDLRISTYAAQGPIQFCLAINDEQAEYEVIFTRNTVEYRAIREKEAYLTASARRATLTEWFQEYSPIITFEDTSVMENCEIFRPKTVRKPYDPANIDCWTWAGVDLTAESKYKRRKNPTRLELQASSIQTHVVEHLVNGHGLDYDIIFDDDGSGEVADIVALKASGDDLHVHLFHCKFSHGSGAGVRVGDFYEVCGQAEKSVHWRSEVKRLFERLKLREQGRQRTYAITRFEKGDLQKLDELRRRARFLVPKFEIYIVQPGLRVSGANDAILDLLGATEMYLGETFAVPLRVIASE